jgi:hypothetical protein
MKVPRSLVPLVPALRSANLGREFGECFVRVAGKMGGEGLAESGKVGLGGGLLW